jgi:hypothetical protein
MRMRAFVHVAGPAKAGKTALVEAMLQCSDALVIAARCGRDDTLAHPRESSPHTHPELRRYRQAGASGTALFRFPGDGSEHDAFFMIELMTDYSEGVVVEGDSPLEFVDLRVFVAPTPANGDELFVQRSPTPDDRTNTAVLEQVLSEPDSVINFLAWAGGPVLGEMGRGHEAFGLGVGVTGTDWPVPTRRRPLRRTMKSSLPSTKTGGPACSSDAANCRWKNGTGDPSGINALTVTSQAPMFPPRVRPRMSPLPSTATQDSSESSLVARISTRPWRSMFGAEPLD